VSKWKKMTSGAGLRHVRFLLPAALVALSAHALELPPGPDVLALDTALRLAVSNSPSLAADRAKVLQAEARVMEARSGYWPVISASASRSRVDLADNAVQPGTPSDNPEDYYKAGVSTSWRLFDGGTRRFSRIAASHGLRGSEDAHKDSRRRLLSAVANAYANAQLAIESVAISDAARAFYRRLLDEAEARRRVGAGSLGDELNLRVQMNSAEADLVRAKRTYRTALVDLAILMGIPDAAFPVDKALEELDPNQQLEPNCLDTNSLVAHALEQRSDIKQIDRAWRQARANLKAVRGGFFPSISLSASLDGERANDSRLENDDFGNTVAAVLSYNMFEGGLTRARYREASGAALEAKKTLENGKITVASEVRKAVISLEAAWALLAVQKSNASSVERNRDLAEREYLAGEASLVRLNEAQRDLIAARAQLVQSLVSLQVARYDLATATGRSLIGFLSKTQ